MANDRLHILSTAPVFSVDGHVQVAAVLVTGNGVGVVGETGAITSPMNEEAPDPPVWEPALTRKPLIATKPNTLHDEPRQAQGGCVLFDISEPV